MQRLMRFAATTTALLTVSACVDHRPVRNGLRDESVYLQKASLTAPNPKEGGQDLWLFKTTVVRTSAPNVLSDVLFPGLESDLRAVKFRFQENRLQVLDGRTLQLDDPDDPDDDLATQTERVMLEFEGEHVDVRLRESLDGERTNFREENTENPWAKRQQFRVDFENTSIEPAHSLVWVYGLYASLCAMPTSVSLVPDSFEWDEEDQYLTFVLDVTYQHNWIGWICTDLFNLYEWDAATSNVEYRMAFYRPGPSSFQPEAIEEKAPENKRYGVFQINNVFRDPISGLRGNSSLIKRWDPDRTEPAVFYFHEGFPAKFKPMFENMKARTNKVLEDAGATLRVDFREWNDDGVERRFGDPRYSFVVWHQGIDQTMGLLGYGPSSAIPWTGEIISANLNLYNIGYDYYRFLIEDFLEEKGALLKPDAEMEWEEIACTAGATVAPGDPVRCAIEAGTVRSECERGGGNATDCAAAERQATTECRQAPRLTSQLFNEMRRVMELHQNADGSADDFIPQPARRDFRADLHRALPELRYAYPPWNRFVYRSTDAPARELMEMEEANLEYQNRMHGVLMGQNPFGTQPLHSQVGMAAQFQFMDDVREGRKKQAELAALKEHLLATRNIYTFDPNDAVNAIALAARRCIPRDGGAHTWESDEEFRERIVMGVTYEVGIHEFGHNLSLRHNFYGSLDLKHMQPGEVSASVMDYVSPIEDLGGVKNCDMENCDGDWGFYDKMALQWIYGTAAKKEEALAQDPLYCTDEHRILSPLCTAHDLGVTPAQITLNAIERYDWLYSIRNRRAFRKFWDTSTYVNSVAATMFGVQRMWHLALFDWGGGGVQSTLKRLDQVGGNRVLTDQEYDEISVDFYNDVSAAIGMMIGFYDAVINQPASFRNYQTEFDPFYGDILRIGIVIDKLYSTFAFMDLQDVFYSPNVQTYVALWDAPFGSQNFALSQRVLDSMLGSNYDTFPWFRYFAVLIYASVSNSNLVGSIDARERIAIWRFNDELALYEQFPEEVIALARRTDNPQQTFVHEGELYVYTHLADRSWHLVAGSSRSPVSFQFIREHNEALNANASRTRDTYGLKILLAYYEFYNNFVGF